MKVKAKSKNDEKLETLIDSLISKKKEELGEINKLNRVFMTRLLKAEKEVKKSKFKRNGIMSENEKQSNQTQNQTNNQAVKKDEKDKAWVLERKSKRAKQAKVRKKQKNIEGKVQREAINEVEDILVRAAFSTLL